MDINYYDILEIESNATDEEVREAYVKMAKLYHPDVTDLKDSKHANHMFVMVKSAYDVLGDSENRRLYDERLNIAGLEQYPGNHTRKHQETTENMQQNDDKVNLINRNKIIGLVFFIFFFFAIGTYAYNYN